MIEMVIIALGWLAIKSKQKTNPKKVEPLASADPANIVGQDKGKAKGLMP